jgi:hypothetical protein
LGRSLYCQLLTVNKNMQGFHLNFSYPAHLWEFLKEQDRFELRNSTLTSLRGRAWRNYGVRQAVRRRLNDLPVLYRLADSELEESCSVLS